MIMSKVPEAAETGRLLCRYTDRARSGLKSILKAWNKQMGIKNILLPAYIGVSPKEGSGIMDPVEECSEYGIHFYAVGRELDMDIHDIGEKIRQLDHAPFIFLRVNWFGFYDKEYLRADRLVKQNGGYVIEDHAHAFFTSLNLKSPESDAAIYSLHKMFPFRKGGMIQVFNPQLQGLDYADCTDRLDPDIDFAQFRFSDISGRCRKNYLELQALVSEYADDFYPIRRLEEQDGVVPQSFPILLKRGDRFQVYLMMNQKGYGVTSLYHTMIPQLASPEYGDAAYVSSRILNLPVHQDVDYRQYPEMLRLLSEAIRQTNEEGER